MLQIESHLPHEVFRQFADVVPRLRVELHPPLRDEVHQGLVVLLRVVVDVVALGTGGHEGRVPGQEDVGDDADRPNVARRRHQTLLKDLQGGGFNFESGRRVTSRLTPKRCAVARTRMGFSKNGYWLLG